MSRAVSFVGAKVTGSGSLKISRAMLYISLVGFFLFIIRVYFITLHYVCCFHLEIRLASSSWGLFVQTPVAD